MRKSEEFFIKNHFITKKLSLIIVFFLFNKKYSIVLIPIMTTFNRAYYSYYFYFCTR